MTDKPTEPTTLVPVRTQTVDFYGDTLQAAQLADETILVPVRPIVEALGLSWPGQFERLKRDPVLSEALTAVRVTRTTATGGVPDMLCLPLKLLPGFLFGLNASRVKPELRERILRYQRDCYDVLWNAFKGDILPVTAGSPAPHLTGAARTLELAEAVYHLARQQFDFERALYELTNAQDRTDARLTALELHLSAGATLSEAQAAELALAVKTVAAALEQQGDRNGYARVYAELYRRYRISSYKNLPAARYEEALGWLQSWYTELTGGGQ